MKPNSIHSHAPTPPELRTPMYRRSSETVGSLNPAGGEVPRGVATGEQERNPPMPDRSGIPV
jgi:hypothetical protein